jgi:hypothetical protein
MAKRLRWMVLGGALTLVILAGGAFGAMRLTTGKSLGDFFFGPKMARAEVVIVQSGGEVHDYRIDRGRVKSIRGGNLELRELDGTVVVVPVSATAQITVNGQPAPLVAVARGMVVTTVRDGTGPALQVLAQGSTRGGRP